VIEQKVVGLKRSLETGLSPVARVDALNALSRELFVYEVDRSLRYAYEARRLAKENGYAFGEGRAMVNEAMGCRIKSDFKKSKQLATAALEIFEHLGHKGGQADALNNISFMELNMEDFAPAVEHGVRALALAEQSGDREVLVFSLLVNGMLHEMLGDYNRAMEHHHRSLALAREITDHSAEGAALINSGSVSRKIGDRKRAKENFEQALQIFDDLRVQLMVSSAHFNLGRIYLEEKDFQTALRHFYHCLQIQKDIGHAQGQGACYLNIGMAQREINQRAEAEENIRQSIELARSFGKKNSECKGLLELAECFLSRKNENEAIRLLEEAHGEAELYGIKEIRCQVLLRLSRAYEYRGDFKKALSYFREGTSLREELMNEDIMFRMKSRQLLQEVESAHVEKEAALREKERAEQSEKFKEEFLANMSHEIRTPMNAIAGLAELLSKTGLNALQSKYINAIRQSSKGLLSIIQDVLDFSKIEAGQLTFESINFSVKECMEGVLDTLQHKAEEKKLELLFHIHSTAPETVCGDPLRLRQVLLNLVGNAIKFTEQGHVKFHCAAVNETEKTRLVFTVEDTGIGIAEDKLEKIFLSFVQASPGTARTFGGTGLGLTISKQLVEKQGGTITVKSRPGLGTVFTFSIPYLPAAQEIAGVSTSPDDADLLHELRILIAEDNRFNQMVAVDSLHQAIPEVKTEVAENGKVTLEKLLQQTYDVLLLDLQMPVMDGYETATILRNHSDLRLRTIPIIALTANATLAEKEKCLAAGMDGYVAKPFRIETLLAELRTVVAAHSGSSVISAAGNGGVS
jgi:signal transduction histidine kinase/ActR/RegA family two-component response regulator